ncbi:hypothetical protein N7448_011120 [Penicillium atrosanguineum]|nr:hypothetical protein N7448_011120 [Penicillium atrosanguineum]
MTNIPIKDMDQWAHRLRDQRLQEEKRRGRVGRPMNAFMFYKCAFHKRTQEILAQKAILGASQQNVSRVAGASWGMETSHIRQKYRKLARIDRDNHMMAFPDYKFKPKRCPLAHERTKCSPIISMTSKNSADMGEIQDNRIDGCSWAAFPAAEFEDSTQDHAEICSDSSSSFLVDSFYPTITAIGGSISPDPMIVQNPMLNHHLTYDMDGVSSLYETMTPENSKQYALDSTTGFPQSPDVGNIHPQLNRSSSSDLTTFDGFESHALMERSNSTDLLGGDRLQQSNSITEGCPNTGVPSHTLHSFDPELCLPWNTGYQEYYSELQDALSGPEPTTISDDKRRILKAQWVSQIPETVAPGDTLLHF